MKFFYLKIFPINDRVHQADDQVQQEVVNKEERVGAYESDDDQDHQEEITLIKRWSMKTMRRRMMNHCKKKEVQFTTKHLEINLL
jgi:hypothetical protein